MHNVKIHILPGGFLPERKTAEAIGFDVALRAIVCPHDMDPDEPRLRKALFNFKDMPEDPDVAKKVISQSGKLVYHLEPGQRVLCGIGFFAEVTFPAFYWIVPRSGLVSKWDISVTNAPATIDPDYRGEAAVSVLNRSNRTFVVEQGMRIAQIVFQQAFIPEFEVVGIDELSETKRGTGGFGSTGIK